MAYKRPFEKLVAPVNTGSGVAEYMLVAQASDFEDGGIKCPSVPIEGDPAGTLVNITAAHEFKAGRGFARVALAPEKNQLSATTIGDTMFQKQDFSLAVFIPGSYAEVHEMVANMLNTQLIVLIKDSNCPANMWYQLGCDCTFAYLKVDFTTGTTKEGVKGYAGTVTWQNPYIQLYAHVDGPEELA